MYEILANKKILSVENNPDEQKYAACSLIKLNVNFFMCHDGCEAIDIIKKNNIDLILMELYLPNMNGIHCIKTLRNEMGVTIPIIVKTDALIELHQEIIPLVNGIILKPYNKKDLLDLVVKVLG